MDGLHIVEEYVHVQECKNDAKESLDGIHPLRRHIMALEDLPSDDDQQELEGEEKQIKRMAVKKDIIQITESSCESLSMVA